MCSFSHSARGQSPLGWGLSPLDYQIDIRREGTLTTYRFVIPWTEPPGFSPAKGTGFSCNIVPGDSYNTEKFGKMVWGGGLKDDSADCGLVTLVP